MAKSKLILSLLLVFYISCSTKCIAQNTDNFVGYAPLNKYIIEFVKANVGKKVGDGQCWTLAAEALSAVNATWDRMYKYGNELKYGKDSIFEGDIIQFENVIIKYKENNVTTIENYPQHTAIIYKLVEDGSFIIAHQNVDNQLILKLSLLRIKNITKGIVKFYRPVK